MVFKRSKGYWNYFFGGNSDQLGNAFLLVVGLFMIPLFLLLLLADVVSLPIDLWRKP